MAFKMGVSAEQLEGIQPVSSGIYEVLFLTFNPKLSKEANQITGNHSINLNAKVKILGHPEFETDRFLFAPLNEGARRIWNDFVHSFGLEMDDQLGPEPSIPGIFDADPTIFRQDDPTTWRYAGPLTSKVAQWEVSVGEWKGKPSQDLRQFICSVPDCATKFPKITHSKDMKRKG